MTGPYLRSDKQRGWIPADFSRGKQFLSTLLHQRLLWDSPSLPSFGQRRQSDWMVKPTGPLRLLPRLSIPGASALGISVNIGRETLILYFRGWRIWRGLKSRGWIKCLGRNDSFFFIIPSRINLLIIPLLLKAPASYFIQSKFSRT